MKDVSVVLATYNEKENILEMVNKLKNHVINLKEIVIVDDNSPDETWKIIQDLNDEKIKLIRRVDERGLASAYKRGLEEAKGDIICWMDCDFCHPPDKLNKMIDYVGEYDVVVGSRFADGGKDKRELSRRITSKSISLFAGLLFGFDFKDYTSGFAAVKKEVFDKVKINPKGYGEYFIDFVVKAKQNNFRLKEVGYTFTDREAGVSKSAPNIKTFLKYGWKYGMRMIKLKFF